MEPTDVVLSFTAKMNQWEYGMYLLSRLANQQVLNHAEDIAAVPDMSYDDFKNGYYDIFERHCTTRERKYGGEPTSWSKQGRYVGVTKESVCSVDEVSDSRVEVVVEGGEFPDNKFLFVLLRKGDQWLIDSAKWGDYDDWDTHYL